MGANAELLGLMGPQLGLVLPELDEKSRRLVLGAVARAAGDGAAELGSGQAVAGGRIRRPGAGRKKLAEADPGLVPALLGLVADSTRGDPESPLVWTAKSVKKLAGELAAAGHRCSPQTCWRLLHGEGFSTQSNAKVSEGKQHPGRDAQFRYIAAQAKDHMAAGQPVISVDAKKKEQVGEYAQAGREWRPRGDPVAVRSHSFPDEQAGHVIPYGVYDVGANTGFVNVGTDHNTAAFAVESVRRWWDLIGKDAYPHAERLLVSCDAGGNNGWRNRAWKAGLAALAQQTGLEITCCHFPPGTSKWNKIEHRLFCQITLAWRGRPLTSHDVIINTIGAVTTAAGLTVTAVLDHNPYPTGTKVSGQQMRDLEDRALTRHSFHGEWNYTLHPDPGPAPASPPPAAPAPPAQATRDQALHALASPALTGVTRHDLAALAARLELPAAAAREQRLHLARGRPRRRPARPAQPRLPLAAQILATIMRQRYGLPLHALAYLLSVSTDTLTAAVKTTAELLRQHDITIPPGPATLRTLQDFYDHAAAAGITIPARNT